MISPLVECVPNFSEGRRPEVVEAISASIAAVKDAFVLDHHMDADHNRSVITFVGTPAAVEEAAFRAIAKAAELIDLTAHTGEHPRIGAADVVPFVPISGITMEECVAMAHRVGDRVGNDLGIPVYFYEEAALKPERKRLEVIRRGQYEALQEEISSVPERAPDRGPSVIGSAGATVIGAREFLIAYNVYLTTDQESIADQIARTIRHSSGGLRFVKALGMLVDGQAQVSMNLTNFRKTSLPLVVEAIRREAQRYGVQISHSELVGLIPQKALVDAAVWYTQLDLFQPEQVLEQKIYAALQEEQEEDFLDSLASGRPTPGGGSAAAYAGAMGAGLVAMVARLTLGKKKYAAVEREVTAILSEAEDLRASLTGAVAEDARAFRELMAAYRIPKDDSGRKKRIHQATLNAARVPLEVSQRALKVMELGVRAAELGNLNAISDAASAVHLGYAALRSAGYNVRINLLDLKKDQAKLDFLSEIEQLDTLAQDQLTSLQTILTDRGGMFRS